jgi:hypothetical protein
MLEVFIVSLSINDSNGFECHFVERRYADCRIFYCYAECRYAECRGALFYLRSAPLPPNLIIETSLSYYSNDILEKTIKLIEKFFINFNKNITPTLSEKAVMSYQAI